MPGAGAQRLHVRRAGAFPGPTATRWRGGDSDQMPRLRSPTWVLTCLRESALSPTTVSLYWTTHSEKAPDWSNPDTRLSGHSCGSQVPVVLRSSFLTPATGGPSATPYTFASDPPPRPCQGCQAASKGPLASSLSSNQQPEGSLATNSGTVQTLSRASSSPSGQAPSSQGPRGPCPL